MWLALFACLTASLVPSRGLVVCIKDLGSDGSGSTSSGSAWEFGLGRDCPQQALVDLAARRGDEPRSLEVELDEGDGSGACVDALADGQWDPLTRKVAVEEAGPGDWIDWIGTAADHLPPVARPFDARAGPPRAERLAARQDWTEATLRRHLAARRSVVLLV